MLGETNLMVERISQIRYIVEIEQSICNRKADVNSECVKLCDEDILSIHWYAEEHLKDSHQVADLVSIIMSVLKRYSEELTRKSI